MLIIDEIHNILGASPLKRNAMMDTIKNLSNQLKIPIVLSGTKDALRAISTNSQISSRFRPMYLTKWKMNKDFITLLATIVSMLPLKKKTNILNKNAAELILEMSEGYIGEIINLLKELKEDNKISLTTRDKGDDIAYHSRKNKNVITLCSKSELLKFLEIEDFEDL